MTGVQSALLVCRSCERRCWGAPRKSGASRARLGNLALPQQYGVDRGNPVPNAEHRVEVPPLRIAAPAGGGRCTAPRHRSPCRRSPGDGGVPNTTAGGLRGPSETSRATWQQPGAEPTVVARGISRRPEGHSPGVWRRPHGRQSSPRGEPLPRTPSQPKRLAAAAGTGKPQPPHFGRQPQRNCIEGRSQRKLRLLRLVRGAGSPIKTKPDPGPAAISAAGRGRFSRPPRIDLRPLGAFAGPRRLAAR